MTSAISGSVAVVGYLTLFAGVGLLFVFVNLLVGRFLRPRNPHAEKIEIYECGEPSIGSSFVQFDLRFYVVALIFIVFDVEVAFLFPWATVFGKADQLVALSADADIATAVGIVRELGLQGGTAADANIARLTEGGRLLRQLAAVEVLVFFVILLVGYMYVWGTGALDWVRPSTETGGQTQGLQAPVLAAREVVLTS